MQQNLTVTLDSRSMETISELVGRYRSLGCASNASQVVRRAIELLEAHWSGFDDDDTMVDDELGAYERREREYGFATGQSSEF